MQKTGGSARGTDRRLARQGKGGDCGSETALTDLDRERAHEAALRRTVATYANSESLATAVYRARQGGYTDVVTAQRSLTNARTPACRASSAREGTPSLFSTNWVRAQESAARER